MKPVPLAILEIAVQMPKRIFLNHNPNGIRADPGIRKGLQVFSRLGCPVTLNCPPQKTWGKILIHYRGYGDNPFTAVVGLKSWFDDHLNNLRLDFDRTMPEQGDSIWAPFVMAISKMSTTTPDFCEEDIDGRKFVQLVLRRATKPTLL